MSGNLWEWTDGKTLDFEVVAGNQRRLGAMPPFSEPASTYHAGEIDFDAVPVPLNQCNIEEMNVKQDSKTRLSF